jgi:anti-sigma B factor antagonist
VQVSVIGNPDDSVVVTLRGSLDIDTAPALTEALDQILGGTAPRVVVDLSGVVFCDSTGLSAFVVGDRRARDSGGWLRLAAPGDFMATLLDTLGLTRRLGVHPTVAAALAA